MSAGPWVTAIDVAWHLGVEKDTVYLFVCPEEQLLGQMPLSAAACNKAARTEIAKGCITSANATETLWYEPRA